jgi:archaellum component FlaC
MFPSKMFMKNLMTIVLGALVFALALAQPAAAGTQEQLIQIQTQLQLVQDNMARMQQSFDERMGVMKDMITQQTDNVNKMGTAVQELQKTLGSQTSDASSKVDQISGQVQALHDAVDELKARMAKVTKQLEDMQAAQQNIGTPPAGAPATGNVAPVSPRPNK